MKDVCPAHSGLEAKITAIVESQKRVEQNLNEIKKSIERVPVLWEVGQTTRNMVYGAYTAIVLLLGYLINHIGGSK